MLRRLGLSRAWAIGFRGLGLRAFGLLGAIGFRGLGFRAFGLIQGL